MKIKKYQQGGPAPAPMPAEQAPVQDPLMQIAEIFAQGLEAQDCSMLAQGAELFLQMVSQAMGPGPVDQAPEAPVFRRGGKMERKCANGSKLTKLKNVPQKK